jgi:hypothetical protein
MVENLLRRKVFKKSNLIEIQMQDNHINYGGKSLKKKSFQRKQLD